MNILVYGAGVLGSLYAARLQNAGHTVTLLARGQRLADLHAHGIVLDNAHTGERTATNVRLVDTLAPDDAYDLVLVLVRADHLALVLPSLAANRYTPTVLFMVNNAAGADALCRALGRERVVLGFPGAGGTRDGAVIHYHVLPRWQQATTIGEIDGRDTPRLRQIADAFAAAGFPVATSGRMDAWLKTHVAWIVPICCAIYAADGNIHRLAHTRDGLVLLIRAAREGFHALRVLGIPLTPNSVTIAAFAFLPEPLLVAALRRLFDTPTADLILARHANAARSENQVLVEQISVLTRAAMIPTPALNRLTRYLDPATPPLPEGSASLLLHRRGAWLVLSTLTACIACTILVALRLRLRHLGRRESIGC